MKTLFIALLISLTLSVYSQNKPAGYYKLILIQNKTTNSLDSAYKQPGLGIDFETDSTLTFFLSPNRCFGPYQILKGEIKMKPFACTEMCCDSALALEFRAAILDSVKFSINKVELVLENYTWKLLFKKEE